MILNKALIALAACAVLGAVFSGGCAQPVTRSDDGRLDVVAAFAPLAEAARRIGGDRVEVTDLVPPGAEPHDVELSTRVLDLVLDADVVVYLKGFQPALDAALERSDARAIDLLHNVVLRDGDAHVWLDPTRWAGMVAVLQIELEDVDPDGTPTYGPNFAKYSNEIGQLDGRFEEGLQSCRLHTVVTAHDAFGYLFARYGISSESIAGVSPEAEPDPKRLADLEDIVRREHLTTIFTEELVSPDVAETLAREAGVDTAVLDPIESRSSGGYIAAMDRNLEALRDALDCS